MVQRTNKTGTSFWGCRNYPECCQTLSLSDDLPQQTPPPKEPGVSSSRESSTPSSSPPTGFLGRVAAFLSDVADDIEKAKVRRLEADEPDATGRWDVAQRKKVLLHVWKRDGRCCGLCGAEMPKLAGAQIEHIVPKIFAVFDVHKGGSVVKGTTYRSLLHKMGNLQAAHSYCNKRKGNTPLVKEWRHPSMSPLSVAVSDNGKEFVVPY